MGHIHTLLAAFPGLYKNIPHKGFYFLKIFIGDPRVLSITGENVTPKQPKFTGDYVTLLTGKSKKGEIYQK
jgi:hypothetical protein